MNLVKGGKIGTMNNVRVIKGGIPRTLIAIPCLDMVHTEFMQSMIDLEKPEGACYTVVKNTLIHEARNIIAANAVKAGFDRVAWFDSDMIVPKDALIRMMDDMDGGCDFVTGLYCTRRPPKIKPVVYDRLWYQFNGDELDAGATNYYHYPDGLFEIEAAGFGCCLISIELIKKVGAKFGSPFDYLPTLGEDLSFCWKARQVGGHLYCDSRIKCGHIGMKVYGEEDLHT